MQKSAVFAVLLFAVQAAAQCAVVSTEYRCKGAPLGGWGGLGKVGGEGFKAGGADDCAKMCRAVQTCKYAVYRPANGQCSSFGSCDEFKTNDPNGPFTTCAVRPPTTMAPVTGAPVGITQPVGASGDPFTKDAQGKRVQFFLPLGRDVSLLYCKARWGGFELLGRVMSSGISGDHQQWFDRFLIRVDGEDKISVAIRDDAKMRVRTNDSQPVVVDSSDDVASSGNMSAGNSSKGQQLNMINVGINVDGVTTQITKAAEVAHDGISIDISQTVTSKGNMVESVHFEATEVSVDIKTALASKFATATLQKLYRHLDITFVRLDKAGCSEGILAELWGLTRMSESTASMLQPQ